REWEQRSPRRRSVAGPPQVKYRPAQPRRELALRWSPGSPAPVPPGSIAAVDTCALVLQPQGAQVQPVVGLCAGSFLPRPCAAQELEVRQPLRPTWSARQQDWELRALALKEAPDLLASDVPRQTLRPAAAEPVAHRALRSRSPEHSNGHGWWQ